MADFRAGGVFFELEPKIDDGKLVRTLQQAADRAAQRVNPVINGTVSINPAQAAQQGQKAGQQAGSAFAGQLGQAGSQAAKGIGASLGGLTNVANRAGGGMGSGLIDGLSGKISSLGAKTGPIGIALAATVGLGLAAGGALAKAISDGMQREVREDFFAGATGLNAAAARRFGQAAGEAYAQNFGESVQDNLTAGKIAIQAGVIDASATQRDITSVISTAQTLGQVLDSDVNEVLRSTGQLIRTGIAKDAPAAFDLITKGAQEGLNVSGDLLDTLTEYSVQFRKLGLDAPTSLGIISQLVKGGARDTDLAADAIKEFSIRTLETLETTDSKGRAALTALGQAFQNVLPEGKDMYKVQEDLAAGGPKAAAAFQLMSTGLSKIEDPTTRSTTAVALFGTQAEDLAGALGKLDVSKAAQGFDDLDGAASRLVNTLGDNAASRLEGAKRSIELAGDDIKSAVAAAFTPQLDKLTKFVSENRAGIVELFKVGADAAFDFAVSVVKGAASGTVAFADFISSGISGFNGLVQAVGGGIVKIADGFNDVLNVARLLDPKLLLVPKIDTSKLTEGLAHYDASAQYVADGVKQAGQNTADALNNTVVPAIEATKTKFDEVAQQTIYSAQLQDQTNRLSNDLGKIEDAGKKAKGQIKGFNGTAAELSQVAPDFAGKIRDGAKALDAQTNAAKATGASNKEVAEQYDASRASLVKSITQMGISKKTAENLVTAYSKIPATKKTATSAPGAKKAGDELYNIRKYLNDIDGKKVYARVALTTNTSSTSANAAEHRGGTGDGDGIERRARGGPVWGAGSATSDSIPALLSNGEYVVKASSVSKYGQQMLDLINQGRYAAGGLVRRLANGGKVQINTSDKGLDGVVPDITSSINRLAKTLTGGALGGSSGAGVGMGYKRQMSIIRAAFPGLPITSTFRPGARTVSGNVSYHARGRAIDMAPRKDVFEWIRSHYGKSTAELIFSPEGARQLKNGKSHFYTGAVRAQHFDHVHWAMANGGLVGMASGGKVSAKAKAAAEKAKAQAKAVSDARRALVTALTGIQTGSYFGNDASLRTDLVGADSSSEVRSAISPIIEALRDARAGGALSGKAYTSLYGNLKTRAGRLGSLANQRAGLATQIDDAATALANAKSARTDYASGVRSGVNTYGGIFAGQGAGVTAATVKSVLNARLNVIKAFAGNVMTLKKQGWSQSIIQQVVDAGPDTGAEMAAALVKASPADRKTIGATVASIDAQGKALGSTTSGYFFDAGVASAQGLVNGLKAKDSVLKDTMEELAESLITALKTKLKINSPSKVMHGLGGFTGQGFADGISSSAPQVAAALDQLMAMPSAVGVGAARGPAAAGSVGSRSVTGVHIEHFHQAATVDGESLFQQAEFAVNRLSI